MEKSKLKKYLDMEGAVHASVTPNEELIISEEIIQENGSTRKTGNVTFVHVKEVEGRLKAIFSFDIGWHSYVNVFPYEEYEIYDTIKEKTGVWDNVARPYIFLIKTPSKVYMYDAFFRRMLHTNIKFDKMYTSVYDILGKEEVNLIRDEEDYLQKRGLYLLRFKTCSEDYFYPVFNSVGRMTGLFRDLDSVSSHLLNQGVNTSRVFEDSISGDEEKLNYIRETIETNQDFKDRHRGSVILTMRRKK